MTTFIIASVFIIAVIAIFVISSAVSNATTARMELRAVQSIIKSQASNFARRKAQLVYRDPYGKVCTDRWEKEKRYIASKVIREELSARLGTRALPDSVLLPMIESAAASTKVADEPSDFTNIRTGIEYEAFCAEVLGKCGWTTRLTKATGDQGTDIVAERNGARVVIQCKFYSKPVGNKAVQEAAAARMHEGADLAIVVSNAPFTKSARQLAGTTGVRLVHHDELPTLECA